MKFLNLKGLQTFLLCAIFSLNCEGCCAKRKPEECKMFVPVDSVLKSGLSDSISSIVLNPKTVTVQRLKVDKGVITVTQSRKLSKVEKGIACFQMATIEEGDTATIVYGRFAPNVRYVFQCGKKLIFADADFGLGKIYFRTENGEVVKRFNISGRNLLKFSCTIFKDDKFLTYMLKRK